MSTKAKCLKCGHTIPLVQTAIPIVHPTGKRYYCRECAEEAFRRSRSGATYSQENVTYKSKPTSEGFTISKEFETSTWIGENLDRETQLYIVANLDFRGWIATFDCTVWVEFKSPIYNGLNGYNKDSKAIEAIAQVARWRHMTDYGTHTNIGHNDFTEYRMGILRQWRETLFTPLQTYLVSNSERCKDIFGRKIGGWAGTMGSNPLEHPVFINLQHKDWVEFRINKYVSFEQDSYATKVCIALFELMLDFTRKIEANRRTYSGRELANKNREIATKYGDKLAATFDKMWMAKYGIRTAEITA